MKSPINSEQKAKDWLTLTVRSSWRNVAIAKIIVIAILSILFGFYFVKQSQKEYERGQEITQEEYLEEFEEYKADLLSSRLFSSNYPFATFIFFIVLGFIFGSYELISFLVGLAIGKIILKESRPEKESDN